LVKTPFANQETHTLQLACSSFKRRFLHDSLDRIISYLLGPTASRLVMPRQISHETRQRQGAHGKSSSLADSTTQLSKKIPSKMHDLFMPFI
jgi:hypothetical protein